MVIYLSENVGILHFYFILSCLIFYTLFWVLIQWLLPFVSMLTGWFLSYFTGMAVLRIVRGSVTSVRLERAESL